MALAGRGARLALVSRDPRRGEEIAAEIAARTGSRAVTVHLADLSSQHDVRRVAPELLAAYPAIHVLVNNAGVVNLRHAVTVDGIETVFATNHLAYFLLTLLLLDRLRASAPARIVNVASDAHRWGRLDFDDLGNERRLGLDDLARDPGALLSGTRRPGTAADHGGEVAVDGEAQGAVAAGPFQAARDVQIGEVEHAALRRGEPQQRQARSRPGEDALAVGEAQRIGVEVAADRDQAVAGGRPRIGKAPHRHAGLRPWRLRRPRVP